LEEKPTTELSFSHRTKLVFEEDKGKIFYEFLDNFSTIFTFNSFYIQLVSMFFYYIYYISSSIDTS